MFVVSVILFSISFFSYGFTANFPWLKVSSMNGTIISIFLYFELARSMRNILLLSLFPANLFFMLITAFNPQIQKAIIFNQSNLSNILIVLCVFVTSSSDVLYVIWYESPDN
jgi:hypothetical protein